MRRLHSILLFASLPLLSGCKFDFAPFIVRSLHPLYKVEDVLHDARLVGRWKDEDSKETWEFSRADGEPGYRCVVVDDDGKEAELEAHLLKIEGRTFLDFFPSEPDSSESLYYLLHILPVHTFASVARIDSTLQLRFPDPDWLGRMIKKDPNAIRHEAFEGREFILSASTGELQRFWLEHLDNEDAFIESIDLQRIEDSVP